MNANGEHPFRVGAWKPGTVAGLLGRRAGIPALIALYAVDPTSPGHHGVSGAALAGEFNGSLHPEGVRGPAD